MISEVLELNCSIQDEKSVGSRRRCRGLGEDRVTHPSDSPEGYQEERQTEGRKDTKLRKRRLDSTESDGVSQELPR